MLKHVKRSCVNSWQTVTGMNSRQNSQICGPVTEDSFLFVKCSALNTIHLVIKRTAFVGHLWLWDLFWAMPWKDRKDRGIIILTNFLCIIVDISYASELVLFIHSLNIQPKCNGKNNNNSILQMFQYLVLSVVQWFVVIESHFKQVSGEVVYKLCNGAVVRSDEL